jgi:hypothetical protein
VRLQTPHLQDRTSRPAIVLPCRLPAALYRASGLVRWHIATIVTAAKHVAQNGATLRHFEIWLGLRTKKVTTEAPFRLLVSEGHSWCPVFGAMPHLSPDVFKKPRLRALARSFRRAPVVSREFFEIWTG